jgi:hypothetical protein
LFAKLRNFVCFQVTKGTATFRATVKIKLQHLTKSVNKYLHCLTAK